VPVPLPGEERWVEGVGAAGGAAYSAVEVNGRLRLRPPPPRRKAGRKNSERVRGVYGDNNYTYLHTWKKNGVLDCREVTEQEQKHS